eukprot:g83157.t1
MNQTVQTHRSSDATQAGQPDTSIIRCNSSLATCKRSFTVRPKRSTLRINSQNVDSLRLSKLRPHSGKTSYP